MKRMNKRTLISIIPAVALLLLAACSQDELDRQGTALPEGEYPLQIGSVTLSAEVSGQPWTRVAENATDGESSEFEDGDAITVSLNGENTTYTKNGTWTTEKTLYWKSTASATVTAWYPVDETINLSDQSNELAYVLQATVPNASYNQDVTLNFTHQLAKVRIVLADGSQMNDVASVEVYGYTSCTNTQGAVSTENAKQDWIKMKHTTYEDGTACWEANVVPGEIDSDNFIRLNGHALFKLSDLNGFTDNTLKAGTMNIIDLTVGDTNIDLSKYDGASLFIGGKVTLTGTNDNIQVTLKDGADVTLDGVNLTYKNGGPVIRAINGENFTLTLKGKNHLTGTTVYDGSSSNHYENDNDLGSGIFVYDGTLTINSELEASLTIDREIGASSVEYYGAGMSISDGGHLVITGGDITIEAVENPTINNCGAGIGRSRESISGKGSITITGGNITINGGCEGGAAIGNANWFNSLLDIDITITGENTVITAEKSSRTYYVIGSYLGEVYIGDGVTVNNVKYTEPYTGNLE